ncbi:phosphatidylglycerophosphatase [Aspergillus saccharolyticus JOP 1030-1]|uniref:Putative hydrolase n=1 Tax=Aspergillus saccharolyticus JOP 1030-1 TaxID=1450539 RepID=A0A318ZYA9_9EURO|nr:putative hydrolase [Aspergillus saccharolyticus JOP 1030-1]PYH40372.1 putative hydrolase [Aspergillus saccharolyticus JOP 1030-1]
MNPPNTNLRAFNLAVSTLLSNPANFLPHLTVPTFTHLPEQIGPAISEALATPTSTTSTTSTLEKSPQIRALVLDKDNTLCPARTTTFPPEIVAKLTALRTSSTSPFNLTASPNSVLIVSNRAGSHPRYDDEVHHLETQLGDLKIPVYRLPPGTAKKPFCGAQVLAWFQERGVVARADEIAVVGDRLGTDVLMAREMGAWSIWCRDGIDPSGKRGDANVLERMEMWVERYLRVNRGLKSPVPKGFAQ